MVMSNHPSRRLAALLLAAVGLAGVASPEPAEAAACPPTETAPLVTMSTLPGYLYYDTSRSSGELDRLQGRTGSADRRHGWHPIGLTLTELQFRMQIRVNTLARVDNSHCAVIAAVDASLGYDKITVYVDRRYPPGSCQHQSVLDHEHTHVAVFRDTLAIYAPKVEQQLTDVAQRLKPVTARTAEQAAAKLQKTLQREMEPLFNEINRRLDIDNARLDGKDNYLREQSRCSKW
jgi:hypothetical protein